MLPCHVDGGNAAGRINFHDFPEFPSLFGSASTEIRLLPCKLNAGSAELDYKISIGRNDMSSPLENKGGLFISTQNFQMHDGIIITGWEVVQNGEW